MYLSSQVRGQFTLNITTVILLGEKLIISSCTHVLIRVKSDAWENPLIKLSPVYDKSID